MTKLIQKILLSSLILLLLTLSATGKAAEGGSSWGTEEMVRCHLGGEEFRILPISKCAKEHQKPIIADRDVAKDRLIPCNLGGDKPSMVTEEECETAGLTK